MVSIQSSFCDFFRIFHAVEVCEIDFFGVTYFHIDLDQNGCFGYIWSKFSYFPHVTHQTDMRNE